MSVLPRSIRVAVIVVSMSCSCRVLYLAEIGVQSLEALLPVAAVLVHPVGDVPQRSRPEPSGRHWAWRPCSMSPARSSTRRCLEIAG